jgi:hypothetical protein
MARPSEQKYSKHAVSYQYCPNGTERCSYCSMFVPYAACTDVTGVIDRNGWCQLYRVKTDPNERRNTSLR